MKLFFSSIFNLKYLFLFFLFLFLISIPFNTKKFILAFDYPINEFNSVFLYLSDLTLLFFVLVGVYFFKKRKLNFNLKISKIFQVIFLFFFLFLIFLIFISENKILALVFFIRIIFLILLFFVLFLLFFNNLVELKIIIFTFLLLGLFESLIGILQFLNGHSLNLWFLGEPVANQFMKGVARYQVFNFSFLRSFGTLPHANIYAAFLVLTLGCCYYFWFFNFKNKEFLKRVFLGLIIFLNILALVYSFSRSGWLAAFFLTIFILLFGFLKKDLKSKSLSLFFLLLIFYILLNRELGWLIRPRLNLPIESPSVNYRLIYNRIGFEIFKDRPFGVGLNNQLNYAISNFYYQKHGLFDKLEFQPIHNLYLLILTETGFFGFIIFLFPLLLLFYSVFENKKYLLNNIDFVWLFLIFLTFLFLGFMDHYFYTLQGGRLMLFLIFNCLLVFVFLNKNYYNKIK